MRTSLGLCDYDVVVVLGALFSRDAATLYERVSVRPLVGRSVGPSVTLLFFGILEVVFRNWFQEN